MAKTVKFLRSPLPGRWLAAVMLTFALVTAGCGGGSSRTRQSILTFRVIWPPGSRSIPTAANSIAITIQQGAAQIAKQVLTRPDQGGTVTAAFTNLPVGDATITADAYASRTASGVVLARAIVPVRIDSGDNTPIILALESTVDHIAVGPSGLVLTTGTGADLMATAFDKTGAIVPLAPTRLDWTSGTPAVATVDAGGHVTAISAGSSAITVADTESGKQATLTVGVKAAAGSPFTTIALKTSDLIYDRFQNRLYASIPSSAGANGNTVAIVDPVTDAVGPFVPVGKDPGKLALSDDGKYLYVLVDGATAVRRVNLKDFTADMRIDFGAQPDGTKVKASDIAVQPGHSGVLAVAYPVQGPAPSVAIFDNGVARPKTPDTLGIADSIAFDAGGARLYGVLTNTSGPDLSRLAVDDQGVTLVDSAPLFPGGDSQAIVFSNGRLYGVSGTVVDPEARVLLGRIAPGAVCVDPALNRVFVLTKTAEDQFSIIAYDPAMFLPLASLDLKGYPPFTPNYIGRGSFVRFGPKGLAYRSSDDRIVLVSPAPGT